MRGFCEERDSTGATTTKRFFAQGEQQGTDSFFYSRDHLGSIRELIDATGASRARYDYDAYGRLTKVLGDKDAAFGFAGNQNYVSGLYLTLYRAYDSTFGRWISQDPIGFEAGPNFYAYVLGSPTNLRDPIGLDIAVIENGPTEGNPFGHTAIVITGEGVYSFGNNVFPGTSLTDYVSREASRKDTTVYILRTTPAQDVAALKYLFTQIGQPLSGVLYDNCSTRSNKVLDAAGVPEYRVRPTIEWVPEILRRLGILPGSAGSRALAAGAGVVSIPQGSTTIPGSLDQFEPLPYPY